MPVALSIGDLETEEAEAFLDSVLKGDRDRDGMIDDVLELYRGPSWPR